MSNFETFEMNLEKYFLSKMKKESVPGAAVTCLDKGKYKYTQCFGVLDKKSKRPIRPDTIFQAGSLAKTLTAWGIMKLVEKGYLELDKAVDNYLSRWHLPVSEFDSNKVTIRRLLSHTAGITPNSYLGVKYKSEMPALEESLDYSKKSSEGVRIVLEPGSKFEYSGGGYTILQLVIEEITGLTFSEYMRNEILDPLGMYNSTFEWDESMKSKIAMGHSYFGKVIPNYLFTEKAATGLYTTIEDISKFLLVHIGEDNTQIDNKVLKPETLELMYKRIRRDIPHGLGYIVTKLPNNSAILYRGINRGWRSQFVVLLNQRSAIAVLTNSSYSYNLIADVTKYWIECNIGEIPYYYTKILEIQKVSRLSALLRHLCKLKKQYLKG